MTKALTKNTQTARTWVRIGFNSVLYSPDETWGISYNPDTSNMGVGFFAGDDGGSAETALLSKDGKYYILNGDWRKEYETLIDKGYNACKKFFNSKKAEHQSSWSD